MAEAAVIRQVFEVEKEDIQGLVASAYGHFPYAAYVLLEIPVSAHAHAKEWLSAMLAHVTDASGEQSNVSPINLAFTYRGLKRIGVTTDEWEKFPPAFRAGMVDKAHRSRILGDDEDSLKYWRWGAPTNHKPDVLLLLYASSKDSLSERLKTLLRPRSGLRILKILRTVSLSGNKEHFGFADGISQPTIKGFDEQYRRQLGRSGQATALNPGEFLLGYTNEFGTITEEENDFGRNGTYLVFRQMEQRVEDFWEYFIKQGGDCESAVRLAAKAIGRWPGGAPLTLSP
jgi:deferrochelatase/peroxidase EfeB